MTVRILFIFTLFLISGGGESKRVTGYSGGGVLIKCKYDTEYASNPKYLCTGLWPCMTKPIWTDVKKKWINRGRFSLFDDTRASQFWVLIRELTVEDSGTYKCGVDISGIDVYKSVELKVEEDQDYEKSISVTGHVGGSVKISCKYPQSHSFYPKFLCRRGTSVNCSYKTSVKERRRWINEGKQHLHDDGKQIFTVIIKSLTEGDFGEYWCGAESDWIFDPGYKVYITQINLRVTEPPATSSSSPSPSTSTPHITEKTSSTASTTTTSPSFKTAAGPDVHPQSSTHISSPTTKSTTSSSSKPPSSPRSTTASPISSVVTGVSVILALLLIGLLFFTLFLRKRSKTQGPASPQSQSHNSFPINHKNSLADYEEIEDTGVSTVYSTARLPTNPSEVSQTVYGNVQLPSSSDFSNPVYSPAQVVYSTARLPTVSSDSSASVTQPSSGTSAEGPTYATVNLSEKADSATDAVTMTTINKENNSCDYATVKC
ncbi:hypothetical protein MHYP_G00103470 [Metynnis hypsauchen]